MEGLIFGILRYVLPTDSKRIKKRQHLTRDKTGGRPGEGRLLNSPRSIY